MRKSILILIALVFFAFSSKAQSASVSPSRLYFDVSPGSYKSQKLRVMNNGTKTQTFTVNFANFSTPGRNGKTLIDTVENVHGMADWLTASPSFFEVAPGELKEIEILLASNVGDAIANCAAYLDIVNMKTGEKTVVKNRGFTILPGGEREVPFFLPKDLPKGNYNILGVIDYGSETDVAAYELDIKIE
ncbi:MAG: hypothetical protein B6I18_07440 [Bacteroidetes bacterium 4572_112]|nr:MAG: hypothetical protein B6I18_07440 [Bacteroidetes bacterium 4572_112]